MTSEELLSLRRKVAEVAGWKLEQRDMDKRGLVWVLVRPNGELFSVVGKHYWWYPIDAEERAVWDYAFGWVPYYDEDLDSILPLCKQLKGFSLAWDNWYIVEEWEVTCCVPGGRMFDYYTLRGDDPAVLCCELYLMAKGTKNED